jgi:hypothetical protein
MEVHAHSHTSDPDSHRGRKKWTHYLWEFFMLFLAVFCGFLAENQREKFVDNTKERDYINLLIEDMQADSSTIHNNIPQMKQYLKGLDTLISEIYLYIEGKADTRIMYYSYHHYCRNWNDVVLSQRAMNEMKNSGNMRLIRNKEAAELIMAIEVFMQDFEETTRTYKQRQEDPSNFGLKIFDFREYQKANTSPSTTPNEDGFLKLNYQPALNTTDPVYLKEFAARVGYYRNTLEVYISVLQDLIPNIEKAINDLKKNYKL